MATRRKANLPSVSNYRSALNSLRATLHNNHRLLLKAHFRSHKHTATASHLSRLIGYSSYRAINLQYGKLGKRLGFALGKSYRPPQGAPASYAIATFIAPDEDHPDWEWKMHGPLAEAIRELKWPLA
jgi:hypothetical protein